MEDFDQKIQAFAALLEQQQQDWLMADRQRSAVRYGLDYMPFDFENQTSYQGIYQYKVVVTPGKKYTKVDFGGSGKYMVVHETGQIFGIKAYGVIHKGHYYGTLDTIHDYYWGGYHGVKCEVAFAKR